MQLHTFLLGVMRAPFSVLSDCTTNDSTCQRLLSSQRCWGSLGHTHTGAVEREGHRDWHGQGTRRHGEWVLGTGVSTEGGRAVAQGCPSAAAMSGTGGQLGSDTRLPCGRWKAMGGGNCVTGEGGKRTRLATAAGRGPSQGQPAPPSSELYFLFSSGQGGHTAL